MKDRFFQKILGPMIKAICELCEQVGITIIVYTEYNDGVTNGSISYHVDEKPSETAKLVLHAAHVAHFDKLAERCLNEKSITEKSSILGLIDKQRPEKKKVILDPITEKAAL